MTNDDTATTDKMMLVVDVLWCRLSGCGVWRGGKGTWCRLLVAVGSGGGPGGRVSLSSLVPRL